MRPLTHPAVRVGWALAALAGGLFLGGCAATARSLPGAVYVGGGENDLRVFDTQELAPRAAIPLPGPEIAMAGGTGDRMYVLTAGANALATVDTLRGRLAGTLPLGAPPAAMTVAPGTGTIYIALSGNVSGGNAGGGSLLRLDPAARGVQQRVGIGSDPAALTLSPDGKRLLLATTGNCAIEVFDAATLRPLGVIALDQPATQLVAPGYGTEVFALTPAGHHVAVVDTERLGLVTYLTVGADPAGMLLKPDGGELYVSNRDASTISVIDTSTLEVAASIWAGKGASGMCVSRDGAFLYVANTQADTVSAIALADRQTLAAVPVGTRPEHVQLTPGGQFLFVTDAGSNDLAVVRLDLQQPQSPALVRLLAAPPRPRDLLAVETRP